MSLKEKDAWKNQEYGANKDQPFRPQHVAEIQLLACRY